MRYVLLKNGIGLAYGIFRRGYVLKSNNGTNAEWLPQTISEV